MNVADLREQRNQGQRRPLWAWLAIVAALAAGCSDGTAPAAGPAPVARTTTGKARKPAAVNASPEQEAVRAWLAENTDSGKWEEVRWWDAIELPPSPPEPRPEIEPFPEDARDVAEDTYESPLAPPGANKMNREILRKQNEANRKAIREENERLPERNAEIRAQNDEAMADHEEIMAEYKKAVAAGTQMKYLRLKYRTQSGGGPKLFDQVFKISAGKVLYSPDYIHFYGRNFPD